MEQNVGTIHLLVGLIFISVDLVIIVNQVLYEVANAGQTLTYYATLEDTLFRLPFYFILFVVLPAVGGFEVGRWVQQRKKQVHTRLMR